MLLFVLIWECRHTYGVEKTWIPFLTGGYSVDGVSNLVIVGVEHRQTVLGLEGVYEVLCWLVEIPTARPNTPTTIQHVAPVGATETGVVVFIT